MNSINRPSASGRTSRRLVGQLVRYHPSTSEERRCAQRSGTGPGPWTSAPPRTRSAPPDGVLLEVLACGVCGTDVRSFYNGDRRIEPPWVLGHEISGEVIEIGPGAEAEVAASGIALGDAVHCISTLWCGRCRLCRGGAENLCLNGELMGFDHPGRVRRPGGDPEHRAQEPVPHPGRPLPRARHVRRPAVRRDLRPQGHRHRARRRRRRDRRRARSAPRTRRSPGCRAPARC